MTISLTPDPGDNKPTTLYDLGEADLKELLVDHNFVLRAAVRAVMVTPGGHRRKSLSMMLLYSELEKHKIYLNRSSKIALSKTMEVVLCGSRYRMYGVKRREATVTSTIEFIGPDTGENLAERILTILSLYRTNLL